MNRQHPEYVLSLRGAMFNRGKRVIQIVNGTPVPDDLLKDPTMKQYKGTITGDVRPATIFTDGPPEEGWVPVQNDPLVPVPSPARGPCVWLTIILLSLVILALLAALWLGGQ